MRVFLLRYAGRIMPDAHVPDDALRAAMHGVRALLLDLDGVLLLKGKPIPGAVEAVADLGRRGIPYLVLTNSSLVSRATLARWAASVGLDIPEERFLSALAASADLVRSEFAGRRVYVICSADARAELAGLDLVDGPGADAEPGTVAAVILGDSPDEITKPNLDRAFRLVLGGAALIGMHRNPWWITPAGPTLDAGAFLVGLEWASGRRARTVGKPSPSFFRSGFERLAFEAANRGEAPLLRSQVAMVGDDVSSDIGGGRRAGLRTVFVRTGKHGDAELEAAATRARFPFRPDGVADSIAEVAAALA
jgi:HAD superfamily hydrolase (TIGR01458 family)